MKDINFMKNNINRGGIYWKIKHKLIEFVKIDGVLFLIKK